MTTSNNATNLRDALAGRAHLCVRVGAGCPSDLPPAPHVSGLRVVVLV